MSINDNGDGGSNNIIVSQRQRSDVRTRDANNNANNESPNAVVVRHLVRRYGKTEVLHSLSLTVPRGAIYALLGPSGCGKTTLLKCLLGLLRPHNGSILVLGHAPGSVYSGIPGGQCGFMPQELALYEEFSIHKNLMFYSKLYGMTSEQVIEKEQFLVEFLQIPKPNRNARGLSGGQKRRVSLALALLNSPPIVILDEPTVGVDPTLRTRIWSHLTKLSQQGTTIIITTHYIEEARQANVVGFMRAGKILREGEPAALMNEFGENTLEAVFLKLCHEQEAVEGAEGQEEIADANDVDDIKMVVTPTSRLRVGVDSNNDNNLRTSLLTDADPITTDDNMNNNANNNINNNNNNNHHHYTLNEDIIAADICKDPIPSLYQQFIHWLPRFQQTYACMWRNIMRFRNNIPALAFVFLLPSLQVILFCIAIGNNPHDLPFGIVNLDAPVNIYINGTLESLSVGYSVEQAFQENTSFALKYYPNENDALYATKMNYVWGYIIIPINYTQNIVSDPRCLTNTTTSKKCVIRYRLDESDEQIAIFLQKGILDALAGVANNWSGYLNIPNIFAYAPIQEDEAVYGSNSGRFTDFIAPGMIITIAFSQSIGLTALGFVMDQKMGTMDRTWAGGVRASELMLSHAITMMFVLSVQVVLLLFFGLVIFHLPMQGSVILVFLICLILGMSGAMYGLVIAALCSDELTAMQLSLGSFFPALLLSGIIWPIEAIPFPLNYVSYALPTTWAASCGRDIMTRGWDITYPEVWGGFLFVSIWCLIMFLIAARSLRVQK